MIPDEAVEAAAGTLHPSWRDHATAEQWQEILRAALEAAAPHMLAEAWDEGFDRGFYDPLAGSTRDASESAARNPYA